MQVVFAVEEVRVLFFVRNTFDLDGCVEQVVFAANQISNLSKRLQRFGRNHVA